MFGHPSRDEPLYISSVKGNIGHLEAASGVASLIKTLLMIRYNIIPLQASFESLNPAIPALEPDRLAIPHENQNWNAKLKIACINNYGASGNNSTLIVSESPPGLFNRQINDIATVQLPKYPIYISANSSSSLAAYCFALRAQNSKLSVAEDSRKILASLSYNLAVKQNRALPNVLATCAATLTDLNEKLSISSAGPSSHVFQVPSKTKPVILVFGGQVKNAVGLSKNLYDSSLLLRSYLDKCDVILRSFGLTGLYPGIFQKEPVADIVGLQSMVFSLQYACSRCWMDSGLKIDAVIGHSLGQFAAMCISGTLSIEEGLKLVSGRASLMQKHWGSERGSMLAIETDSATLNRLLSRVNALDAGDDVEIACYNGPTSFVLVGREASIAEIQKITLEKSFCTIPTKTKRLNVTHGFHSIFTEPLIPSLVTLAGELTFHDPIIPLETCSDGQSWSHPTPGLIAEHTRSPVYFAQAVNRITDRLGPCTWLEAGSASSVTGMVRRALNPDLASQHSFQSAELSNTEAVESLGYTTVNLWKWGHKVQFWHFHQVQKQDYMPMNLPPYQFEKTKHWLDWKEPSSDPAGLEVPSKPVIEESLISFIGYTDQEKHIAEFSVSAKSNQWKAHVSGHAVLGEPLCPAPIYVELSTQAAVFLDGQSTSGSLVPLVEGIEIKAPLGLAQDSLLSIIMIRTVDAERSWKFEMRSQPQSGQEPLTTHATGRIILQLEGPGLIADFARYEKLIGYGRIENIKSDPKTEILQGAMVYKMFSKVVTYADWYRGVRGVFSLDGEAVGKIVPPAQNEKGLSNVSTAPLALDSFIQVSGLHVNNLNECGTNQVYVCTKIDRIQISPDFKSDNTESRSWDVYTNFCRPSERTVSNDIYVFETSTQSLVMIILGAAFTRVAISSLAKVLSQANKSCSTALTSVEQLTRNSVMASPSPAVPSQAKIKPAKTLSIPVDEHENSVSDRSRLQTNLQELIHRVADVPAEDVNSDISLEQLGIDSLMITEIASEIAEVFKVDIDPHEFEYLPNINSLTDVISKRIDSTNAVQEDPTSSDSDSDFTNTPNSLGESVSSTSSVLGLLENIADQLAKLLATHTEATETIDRDTNLAALGLDSLMCMELATDIKTAFGADLDMHLLNDESAFGDLCDMVIKQQKPSTVANPSLPITSSPERKRASMETVVYKQVGSLPLKADLYYPSDLTQIKRPVGNAP